MQIDFQRVLIEFNKDKPNWYGWKKPEDGEVLSNVKVVKDGATIPTQAEFDSKKQELEVQRDRRNGYGYSPNFNTKNNGGKTDPSYGKTKIRNSFKR